MNIKAVLVDDEVDSIGAMMIQLNRHCPQVQVVGSFSSSEEALQFLQGAEIDILFIDIEMPILTGFEILSRLGKFAFKVVFVSAYDEFGIKAIKFQAFDYLLKPVDPEELKEVIAKYKSQITENEHSRNTENLRIQLDDRILIPIGSEMEFLHTSEILRCESDDNYTMIFLTDRTKIIISKTLKHMASMLPPKKFIRVHSSHLIHVDHIKSYHKSDGGYFEMTNGDNIPLSRNKKDEILNLLGIT